MMHKRFKSQVQVVIHYALFQTQPQYMQMRAAEFFAGIGLMRMGLDREGWTTVWANDLDEKKKGCHHFITKS